MTYPPDHLAEDLAVFGMSVPAARVTDIAVALAVLEHDWLRHLSLAEESRRRWPWAPLTDAELDRLREAAKARRKPAA